jgi:hypothetical protein
MGSGTCDPECYCTTTSFTLRIAPKGMTKLDSTEK